ncbi:MAG: hypothetical protein COA96_03740 [SAR86 cluster bacterium]|uniref:Uncharacterized protein n=1 Tax=SAR86 cluster bacterium TaxID=2030880 RepID=A0A2A5B860_9GAMM|nr:MAG: hypothetical protein COA96_03740 [SAR86 cluster bacterium]
MKLTKKQVFNSMGVAALFAMTSVAAQDYVRPFTEFGAPDLQGTWSAASITNLTRPKGIDKLVVSADEALELERSNIWNRVGAEQAGVQETALPDEGAQAAAFNTRGYNYFWIDPGTRLGLVRDEIRTSWITNPENGRIPYVENGRRMQRNQEGIPRTGSFDGPETRPLAERCLLSFSNAGGPVMQNGLYNNTFQIVQNKDYVMILVEMVHDARIIRIDKGHQDNGINRWLGDSIGYYDGETLVVETINPNPLQRAYITANGKVTERFTRWSEDQVLYEFSVEDPLLYTQTWGGEMSLNRSAEPLYEYACHEGNHSFPGILAGARRQEIDGQIVEDNVEVER